MASSSSSVMGLLALIAASLLSSTASGSPAPPPQEPHQAFLLAPILSNLGFQELAMAVPAIYSPVLSAWSGPLTLFAPSDDTLHSCPSCSPLRLLREHLVPGLFSLPYLSTLAFGTKLETASPGRCLTVTSSAAAALRPRSIANSSDVKIFVDGVEVTRPDLFNDGRFVIHGIGGFVAPLSPLSCSHGDPHPAIAAGASDCPGSAIVQLMLRDAVARLRDSGFSILALAMRVKHAELSGLQNMTVFALDDPSIFAGGHGYVTEVRFHVVPNRLLTHADLLRLPPGAILPTLVQGQHLVVTHAAVVAVGPAALGPASGLRINYVPIKVPDVVTNARIAVHSIFLPFPHLYVPVQPSAVAAKGGICGDKKGPCGASVECEVATEVVDFLDDGP
ncbi:fasciclin-like arabinogalactan protein 21 [Elaeis guineensis]|uniref:Fasciclin-like arabinogalactan protein 21 n=1 Tax=Elaeis guineensis var. tenera TaxID=51953 RepID=A0A6I9SAS0_ELAGV|nr:fasciclin-like arabinogalactan protein 21 [Elaeis guineensis]